MNQSPETIKHLESLAQLDIDAVHAYTAAIDRIDLADVKAKLIEFRADHERHITDLSAHIERLGGTVPEFTRDFKGFLIQGFTAIRSMISNESAINAMKTNEELTNKRYEEALSFSLPPDAEAVIRRNREDERRHLAYIEQCINASVWERSERTVA